MKKEQKDDAAKAVGDRVVAVQFFGKSVTGDEATIPAAVKVEPSPEDESPKKENQ